VLCVPSARHLFGTASLASSALSASAELLVVILVTQPKSYIETTDRRDFGGKPSKLRWRRVLSWKIPDFFSVGGARSKNSIFRVFRVHVDCPVHSLQETVLPPNQWYQWKAETLKVCLLLMCRVCDQAFGRYRPRGVPKSGYVTITKIENLHINKRRKIHWFQNAIRFDLRQKNNEVIAEQNVSEEWSKALGRLELTLVFNTSWLFLK